MIRIVRTTSKKLKFLKRKYANGLQWRKMEDIEEELLKIGNNGKEDRVDLGEKKGNGGR